MKPIPAWLAVLLPVVASFVLAALELPPGGLAGTAYLSLGAGVSALALMGFAAVLGARWPWVESALGGLDRIYLAHKWMGVWALGLASFHLLFRAGMPDWDPAAIMPLPPVATRLIRQLSFVGLMFTVALALNREVGYDSWRGWHKLSGVCFVVVVLHWLSFRSPITLASPAGIWLGSVAALGIAAVLYKWLLYPWLSPHARYRVVRTQSGSAAVHLELEPVSGKVAFRPGQFGFLSLRQDGLREPHPFTVAGGSDGRLDLWIRNLGDFTGRLIAEVHAGMDVMLRGPYGRFLRQDGAAREVWIAGGVGISPFLAWLRDPAASSFDRVTLFYFHTPGRDFPAVEEVRSLAAARGAELVPVPDGADLSSFRERLAAIIAAAGAANVNVDFCGPQGLLLSVRRTLAGLGVPRTNVRHEYFRFR